MTKLKDSTDMNYNNEIIDSLELAEESIPHFLTFIKACGFNMDHREYKRLEFLIKNRRDIKGWLKLFNKDIDTISETTNKFKANKIKDLNISLDGFIKSSSKNLKNGLDSLFQSECSDEDLKIIHGKLHSNEVNLEMIYNKCKGSNLFNSSWMVARSNWSTMDK